MGDRVCLHTSKIGIHDEMEYKGNTYLKSCRLRGELNRRTRHCSNSRTFGYGTVSDNTLVGRLGRGVESRYGPRRNASLARRGARKQTMLARPPPREVACVPEGVSRHSNPLSGPGPPGSAITGYRGRPPRPSLLVPTKTCARPRRPAGPSIFRGRVHVHPVDKSPSKRYRASSPEGSVDQQLLILRLDIEARVVPDAHVVDVPWKSARRRVGIPRGSRRCRTGIVLLVVDRAAQQSLAHLTPSNVEVELAAFEAPARWRQRLLPNNASSARSPGPSWFRR